MRNIRGAVGGKEQRPCPNTIEDQIAIVNLLNQIPEHFGGSGGKLTIKPVEGWCSDELFQAIIRFQTMNVVAIKPNGTIEPCDLTLHFLNRLADRSFPIKRVENYAIESFVEDLYEDTIAEAYRDFVQVNSSESQPLKAKSIHR